MTTDPIEPARITFGEEGSPPFAPDFGDVYHARAGALAQARHVFLAGNDLPRRWQGRQRFVVLETGFGLGHNFLATWDAWRGDARRCERLWYVAIDKHPPRHDDLARAHAASPLPELARTLVRAWPPLSPDLHTLALDDARVMLLLAFGDVARWLPQLVLDADAVYLDGFAPARNPAMWEPRLLKALTGRVAPGATAATWSVARSLRDGLASAGFVVERAPGFGGKREMTVARFAPAYTPRRARSPGRQATVREAVVVGAGLAGAAAAQALARDGWQCTVLERAPQPASGASGNAGGLFHAAVDADDGTHARALRAAALDLARQIAPLIDAGIVRGRADGLLHVQRAGAIAAMRALLARRGLPPQVVQALDRTEAASLAGVPVAGPAWWYPSGGWLSPATLVRHWLATPGIVLRTGIGVHDLRRDGDAWLLLDAQQRPIARSATVVLANADDALRLLGRPPWPLGRRRGQVTLLDGDAACTPMPRLPLTGDGYALRLPDGRLLCGATRHAADDDPSPRFDDHVYNLERLRTLCATAPAVDAVCGGCVGWRFGARDRLPVVGPVPAPGMAGGRVRDIGRVDGLFVCTAFGSRGITWSAWAGALLAAWAAGHPFAAESRLIDALDPARFAARAGRGD